MLNYITERSFVGNRDRGLVVVMVLREVQGVCVCQMIWLIK